MRLPSELQVAEGLSSLSKDIVELMYVNDNSPEVFVNSLTSSITENSLPETVVILISMKDCDSGDNRTSCFIQEEPFALKFAYKNY